MPQDSPRPAAEAAQPSPGLWRGLSGKVLAFTIAFVMIGEVLIFLPSIANFRVTWLKSRIAMAEIAALALEAAPDQKVSADLQKELLMGAGVKVVALKRGASRHLVLGPDRMPPIDAAFDLRRPIGAAEVTAALGAFWHAGERTVGVVDVPPNMSGEFIELALDERPLFRAMLAYSFNILTLSIILSLAVAAMVYVVIARVLVRPIQRLSANMLAFSGNPEDRGRIIRPSARRDEIGTAERELANMQSELADVLQQRSRLAALGLAVSKVSHDLRNMLASAQLISDRLTAINDPTVQKFAPKLIASLDRAIAYCDNTLRYGRAQEAPPRRDRFALRPLVEEAIDAAVAEASSEVVLYNAVADDVVVDADGEQVFRILMNLVRNAAQVLDGAIGSGELAGEGQVHVRAWRIERTVVVEVADNGPGVPPKAREHLFEAFRNSMRQGGTGLGLAIVRELVQAHGGDIRLVDTTGGATFQFTIPDRLQELKPGRRGERAAG